MNLPEPNASDKFNGFTRQAKRYLPLALVTAGIAGLQVALRRFVRRPLPPFNGTLVVKGLRRPAEVIRDPWGVPHISAENEHDLFFAQGFVHAQDRLFQMDANRRVGSGRLGEIVGPLGLPSDRFARFFGWTRAAKAQFDHSDVETRSYLEAYADGVNAFIRQGPLPVEFSVLAYKPDVWQVLDTAAWGTVLAWGLSVNWETEMMRAMLLDEFGPEKTADLTPLFADDYPAILSDSSIGKNMAAEILSAYQQAMAVLPMAGEGFGSNNWVLSGRRTASGRPILANDPHLPPVFPTIWYENHLTAGQFNVTGFTMPGIPGVVIGHNEHIAWGVTNGFPDVQDTYIERFHPTDSNRYEVNGRWHQAEVVQETIKVRGRKPVVEQVRYTRHGPVFSDMLPGETRDLSLRWSAYGRNNHMRSIFQINQAHDWDSFRQSLRFWGFPSQNVVYADNKGNIGYMLPGLIPKRPKGSGLVPGTGWNDANEWQGWIPFEELPSRYNPPEGYIVTANNKVEGDSYPWVLTSEWLPGYRAQRICSLIEAREKLTLSDNERMQQDTVSLMARRFLAAALPQLKNSQWPLPASARAYQLLQQWQGDMRADQIAPSIYYAWIVHFNTAVMEQALGSEVAEQLLHAEKVGEFTNNPFHRITLELSVTWLEKGAPDWVGSVLPLLNPTFNQAISALIDNLGPDIIGWEWGKLHQLNLHNYLTRLPALGRLWKPLTMPLSGDGFTINQSDVKPVFPPDPVHIIASCRMVIDVGEWDNSKSALPGGQSGQFASPHYQDSAQDWQHGRYHPMLFSRSRIEAASQGALLLKPKR